MIRPNVLLTVLGVLAFVMGIFVALVALNPQSSIAQSLTQEIRAPLFLYIIIVATPFGIALFLANAALWDRRMKIHDLQLKLRNAEKLIDDERIISQTDLVTSIPNHRRLQADFETFTRAAGSGRPYQVIMLDIMDFGAINKRFSHMVGDVVLRTISQHLQNTIRRSEHVFKHSRGVPEADNVYRRYDRGDEFVILVEGDEVDAIGFLNRLDRQSDAISRAVLQECREAAPDKAIDFSFSFVAGICKLMAKDKLEDVMERVDGCLLRAQRRDEGRRVHWQSRMGPEKFPTDSGKRRLYEEAVGRFGKSS